MATDVVVLFALDREARPFRRLRPDVPVHLTGVGVERAAAAIRDVLDQQRPQHIILAGFGGALKTELKVGDVIVARDVADETGLILNCDGRGTGRILTVNRMIGSVEEKLELGRRYEADVCDMESVAVAEICRAKGVGFLAVRAVSDAADRHLSPTLDRLIVNGQVLYRQAALAMVREPKLMMEFWRLARNTRIAAKRLAIAVSDASAKRR